MKIKVIFKKIVLTSCLTGSVVFPSQGSSLWYTKLLSGWQLPSLSLNNKNYLWAGGALAAVLLANAVEYYLRPQVGWSEWLSSLALSKSDKEALQTFDELVEKSKKFHRDIIEFSTVDNRIQKIAGNDDQKKIVIGKQAKAVRPIMHLKVKELIQKFLEYKKKHGSEIEKKVYKTMTVDVFVDRLLVKRSLVFMTDLDKYWLRDGSLGSGGFETIGTNEEKKPLVLEDYLSYDEMQISALLGVSVPTYFINNGNRDNKGNKDHSGNYQETGVYTGLVGARFEKPGLMEWQHMMVTQKQNTSENGYGESPSKKNRKLNLWSAFYEIDYFPTFEEAQQDKGGRFVKISKFDEDLGYLDTEVYKKRLKMVLFPFLVDANECGKKENKRVYCHAVGLGMGVWQVNERQEKLMLEVYADIIKNVDLPFITDIDFSWFGETYKGTEGLNSGQKFATKNDNDITIHFSQRNPAAKLVEEHEGKLLVAMYAWDANAYPGNEYWADKLSASGDPAAASCSTIPELQNPLINPAVSAKNLLWVDGSGVVSDED